MEVEWVRYDWGQMTKLCAKLAATDDCLQRALDELERSRHYGMNAQYVEKQVNLARQRIRRSMNILRESRAIDILLGAFELTPEASEVDDGADPAQESQ